MRMDAFEQAFGADEDWERPGPTVRQRINDVWAALGFFALSALGSELSRSVGAYSESPRSLLEIYGALGSAALLLIWRRSHPVIVPMAATMHLLFVGSLVPLVVSSLPMQLLYFFAIYSGVAWAKDRRIATYLVAAIAVATFAWVAWFVALSSGMQELTGEAIAEGEGPIPPILGVAGLVVLNNVMYFGGAALLGQVAWRRALNHAHVVEQAATISDQAQRLRDQAVVAERLRIARELHDVVAHHISVMGVQAAGARRVMDHDRAATAQALRAIEESSRDAVAQMRDLLGTLRTGEREANGAHMLDVPDTPDRSPQPGLADLPALVEAGRNPGCSVRLTCAPEGDIGEVSAPVQLSVYRIVQEALANVRKHSTASLAPVVIRIERDVNRVEVEVVDNGITRRGTGGTGLGLLGMSERARHLCGGLEIGARRSGGYRVRAWFPMDGARREHDGVRNVGDGVRNDGDGTHNKHGADV